MQKGVGFRVNLEVYDSTGATVTATPAVTALVSIDGGAYTQTTNTPVTASSNVPYVLNFLLTDAEASGSCIHIVAQATDCIIPAREYFPEANWTDTKSAYLDATVTSRASSVLATAIQTQTDNIPSLALSGTALSTAIWTPALTGVISTNLDTTVSSRAHASGVNVTAMATGVIFAIASELLTLDWNDITDTVGARSALNALRALRNKIAISGTTISVYEEDDTTLAWDAAGVAAPGATPISEIDPN